MSNTHYDDMMNILIAVNQGEMDINDALADIHEHVKQEAPDHGPQTIIVIGIADVHYENGSLEKTFIDDVVLLSRPGGSVVVMLQDKGVTPQVYIKEGAEVLITKKGEGINFLCSKGEEEVLSVKFHAIQYSSRLQ